ncbi:MAG: hypothetical protein KIT62_06060 [Cyclobacteriaceae bacterium]|nr:hypothetical protein [Cyclobacteriaceae bacterium]
MKIKHLFSVLLVLVFGTFTSCELFEKVDDVTFNVVLPLDFGINEEAENPGGMSYFDEALLDANSNADIAKYASKIKEFKIDKITYAISDADPTTVIFTNGSLVVASTGKTIATESSASLANTAETDLTANIDGFNDLAARLLDDKQELVQLNGTFSQTPVAFNVRFRFYVKVTANAL